MVSESDQFVNGSLGSKLGRLLKVMDSLEIRDSIEWQGKMGLAKEVLNLPLFESISSSLLS